MREPNRNWNKTYQLILRDDEHGAGRMIEFEASGAESALYVAQAQCRGREVELMHEGRCLGRLKCTADGGYWVISPPESTNQALDPA